MNGGHKHQNGDDGAHRDQTRWGQYGREADPSPRSDRQAAVQDILTRISTALPRDLTILMTPMAFLMSANHGRRLFANDSLAASFRRRLRAGTISPGAVAGMAAEGGTARVCRRGGRGRCRCRRVVGAGGRAAPVRPRPRCGCAAGLIQQAWTRLSQAVGAPWDRSARRTGSGSGTRPGHGRRDSRSGRRDRDGGSAVSRSSRHIRRTTRRPSQTHSGLPAGPLMACAASANSSVLRWLSLAASDG